jgi:hypothetical protein
MVSNGYKWLSGWWFQPTPLKNDGVSWDYEIPNIWKKKIWCSNFFRANSDLAAVVHHSDLPNRGSPFQEEMDVFTMSLERLTSPNALCFWKDFKLQIAFGSGKINEFPNSWRKKRQLSSEFSQI